MVETHLHIQRNKRRIKRSAPLELVRNRLRILGRPRRQHILNPRDVIRRAYQHISIETITQTNLRAQLIACIKQLINRSLQLLAANTLDQQHRHRALLLNITILDQTDLASLVRHAHTNQLRDRQNRRRIQQVSEQMLAQHTLRMANSSHRIFNRQPLRLQVVQHRQLGHKNARHTHRSLREIIRRRTLLLHGLRPIHRRETKGTRGSNLSGNGSKQIARGVNNVLNITTRPSGSCLRQGGQPIKTLARESQSERLAAQAIQ